jgi:hypothetical protein
MKRYSLYYSSMAKKSDVTATEWIPSGNESLPTVTLTNEEIVVMRAGQHSIVTLQAVAEALESKD